MSCNLKAADLNETKMVTVKCKKVAPEGGWGYMVGLGMAVSFVVVLGPSLSFGIVYGDFLKSLGEETSAITLLNSAFFTSLSFSGLLSNSLFKKFSCRQVGLTGAILFFIGSSLTVLARSVAEMIFTYSVLQGMGFGLMIPATFTTFNAYFVEKRAMVMAISQTLIGVGGMVYPFLLQSLMEAYGYRGTLAIMAAINAHAIVGMVVMQPAEWHLRSVEVEVEMEILNAQSIENIDAKLLEKLGRKKSDSGSFQNKEQNEPLLTISEANITSKMIQSPRGSPKMSSNTVRMLQKEEMLARRRGSSIISLGNYPGTTEYLRDIETGAKTPALRMLQKEEMLARRRGSSIISLGNYSGIHDGVRDLENGTRTPVSTFRMLQREDLLARRRQSSIVSLGNWTGAVVVSDVGVDRDSKGGLQVIVDFLDLTLLKDLVYVNIVIGISFALYSDVTFFTLEPIYLFTLGWTKSEAAICISIGAAADLASRIFLAVSSVCITVRSRDVFLAGAFFSVIGRIGFLFVGEFTGVLVMTAVLGFFRTWIHVPLPLVFAEHFTQERFPSAYGLFMFLQGIIMFAIGPITGYVRDVTGSYTICFHVLMGCMLVCVVPWMLECVWLKIKQKPNADTST